MKKEQKEIDNNLKIIARTTAVIFIVLIISKIITIIYRIVIGRYFGPEEFGLFSLALTIFSVIIMFSSIGLFDGLLRFVSIYRGKDEINKIRHVFRISLAMLLLSSLLFALILFLLSGWISESIFHNTGLIFYLNIFSLLIPINAIGCIFLYLLRGYEKAGWQSFLVNIVQNSIKILALILFIFLGLKSGAIIYSYMLGALSVSLFAYIICRYKLPEVFLKPILDKGQKSKILKDLLSYSWPITFLSVFTTLLLWTDSFVIGYFNSATEVGFYNAVTTILTVFALAPEMFMQILFPLINKAYSKNNLGLVRELSKQVTKWIFIINVPLFLITFLFPGMILNVIFGKEYLAAINVLKILSFSSLFISINISSNLLLMGGKSKIILIDTILIAIFNLIIDIILVRRYGMSGAAVATLISILLLGFIFIIQAKKYTNIFPFKRKMIGIFIISVILIAIVAVVKEFMIINLVSLTLIGIIFFLVYFWLIYLTGCLDENDFNVLRHLIRKIFYLMPLKSSGDL